MNRHDFRTHLYALAEEYLRTYRRRRTDPAAMEVVRLLKQEADNLLDIVQRVEALGPHAGTSTNSPALPIA